MNISIIIIVCLLLLHMLKILSFHPILSEQALFTTGAKPNIFPIQNQIFTYYLMLGDEPLNIVLPGVSRDKVIGIHIHALYYPWITFPFSFSINYLHI